LRALGTPRPGANGGVDLAAYLDRLVPSASEAGYERVVGSGFARRYVQGNKVADLCGDEMGHGTRLLAETAGSVTGMAVSAEATDVAVKALPAPNVRYEVLDPSGLPFPDGQLDVVVAIGLAIHLDRPEELVAEARRVLNEDGVLVISFPDGEGSDGSATRGMLDRHFGRVRAYRLGAVSGGIVYPDEGVSGDATLLESVALSPVSPRPGVELPAAASVVAVCGGMREEREEPYLLLDRDRRIFDECADLGEDLDGLRDEIENMQRTEVQAFRDALKLRDSEISYLRARVRRAEGRAQRLQIHMRNMERSMVWRIFEPYRRLRAGIEVVRRIAPGGKNRGKDRR